jgi:hypothetical protein
MLEVLLSPSGFWQPAWPPMYKMTLHVIVRGVWSTQCFAAVQIRTWCLLLAWILGVR